MGYFSCPRTFSLADWRVRSVQRYLNKSENPPIIPSRAPSYGSSTLILQSPVSRVTVARTHLRLSARSSRLTLSLLIKTRSLLIKTHSLQDSRLTHSARHSTIYIEPCSLHSSAPHSSSWSFSPSSSLTSPHPSHRCPLSSSKVKVGTPMRPIHPTSTASWFSTFPLPSVRPRDRAVTDKVFDLTSFQRISSHCS